PSYVFTVNPDGEIKPFIPERNRLKEVMRTTYGHSLDLWRQDLKRRSQGVPIRARTGNHKVDGLLEAFYSKNCKERHPAKETLLTLAQESVEVRNQIIQVLISMLNDPILEDLLSGHSEMWYETAFLLGKFKAMEAIDTLIEHLDYNNGT